MDWDDKIPDLEDQAGTGIHFGNWSTCTSTEDHTTRHDLDRGMAQFVKEARGIHGKLGRRKDKIARGSLERRFLELSPEDKDCFKVVPEVHSIVQWTRSISFPDARGKISGCNFQAYWY